MAHHWAGAEKLSGFGGLHGRSLPFDQNLLRYAGEEPLFCTPHRRTAEFVVDGHGHQRNVSIIKVDDVAAESGRGGCYRIGLVGQPDVVVLGTHRPVVGEGPLESESATITKTVRVADAG